MHQTTSSVLDILSASPLASQRLRRMAAETEPVRFDAVPQPTELQSLRQSHRSIVSVPSQLLDLAVARLLAAGLRIRTISRSDEFEGASFLVLVEPHDVRVVPVEPAHRAEILTSFTTTFGAARTPEHWNWKYRDSPYGAGLACVALAPAAVDTPQNRTSEAVVALYGGYQLPVKDAINDRVLRCTQIGDIMTTAAVRSIGRGPTNLLAQCAAGYYARATHIDFDFGVNTRSSRKFTDRFLGVQRLAPVVRWQATGDRLQCNATETHSYTIRRVQRVGREFDELFERCAADYRLSIVRDAQWIRWRYLDCPDDPPFHVFAAHREDRLVGWSVFRRRAEDLFWADAWVDPQHLECVGPLLAHAVRVGETTPSSLAGWFSTGLGWWVQALEGLGFQPQPDPDQLSYGVKPHALSDALSQLERWYTTAGDTDLV